MTDSADGVNNTETEGLPKLNASKKTNKKKKFPAFFVLFLLVIFGGVAYGIQLFISDGGYFVKQAQKVIEPAEPVFNDATNNDTKENGIILDLEESTSDEEIFEVTSVSPDRVSEDEVILETDSVVDERLSDEAYKKVSDLVDLLTNVVEIIEYQKEEMKLIKDGQNHIISRLTSFESSNRGWTESIGETTRDNGRWLTGISNQLRDINLNVKNEKESFPLVVYHINIWGNDTYLTVAPKEHPDQTRFMKEGEITGRWKLVAINSDAAEFHHFNGNVKKVSLL